MENIVKISKRLLGFTDGNERKEKEEEEEEEEKEKVEVVEEEEEEEQHSAMQSPQTRKRKYSSIQGDEEKENEKKRTKTSTIDEKQDEFRDSSTNILRIYDDEEERDLLLDFHNAEDENDCERTLVFMNYTSYKVKISFSGIPSQFDLDVEDFTMKKRKGGIGTYREFKLNVEFTPQKDDYPISEKIIISISIKREAMREERTKELVLKVYDPKKRKFQQSTIEGLDDSDVQPPKRRKLTEESKAKAEEDKRKSEEERINSIQFIQENFRSILLRNEVYHTTSNILMINGILYIENWIRMNQVIHDEIWNALCMLSRIYTKSLSDVPILIFWVIRVSTNPKIQLSRNAMEIFQEFFLSEIFSKHVKTEKKLNKFINEILKEILEYSTFLHPKFCHQCFSLDLITSSSKTTKISIFSVLKFLNFVVSNSDENIFFQQEDFWKSFDIFLGRIFRSDISSSSNIIEITTEIFDEVILLFDELFKKKKKEKDNLKKNNNFITTNLISLRFEKIINSMDINIDQLFSFLDKFWKNEISKIFLPLLLEKCMFEISKLLKFIKKLKKREEEKENNDDDDDPTCSNIIKKIVKNRILNKTEDEIICLVIIEENELFRTLFSSFFKQIESVKNLKDIIRIYINKFITHEITMGEINKLEEKSEQVDNIFKLIVDIAKDVIIISTSEEKEEEEQDLLFKKLKINFEDYQMIIHRVELYDIFRSTFVGSHRLLDLVDKKTSEQKYINQSRIIKTISTISQAKGFLEDHLFFDIFEDMKIYSSSDLFLAIWNESLESHYHNINNNNHHHSLKTTTTIIKNNIQNNNNGVLEDVEEEIQLQQQPQQQQIQQQQQQQQPQRKIVKLLSIHNLRNIILPETLKKIELIYKSLRDGKISLESVENTFREFTPEQIEKEISFLFKIHKNRRGAKKCTELVKNSFFILERSSQIPQINSFYEVFKSKLRDEPKKMPETNYRNMEIKEVEKAMRGFKEMINKIAKSEDLMDILVEISKSSNLISFFKLKEEKGEDEFNQFIDGIKTITTDAFILDCSYHLTQARKILSPILFPSSKTFESIDEILDTINLQIIKGGGDDEKKKTALKMIGSLRTARTHLNTLEVTFVKHTTSLDFLALENMEKIEEIGFFIIDLNSSTDDRILCELKDNNKTRFTMNEIREIKLMILNSSVISDSDDDNRQKRFEIFNELQSFVDTLMELNDFFSSIETKFSLDIIRTEFPVHNNNIIRYDFGSIKYNHLKISKDLEKVKNSFLEFHQELDELQIKYYFLNYFSTSEVCHVCSIKVIDDYLHQEEVVLDYLRLIDFNLSSSKEFLKTFNKKYRNLSSQKTENKVLSRVQIFGESLEIYFEERDKNQMIDEEEEDNNNKLMFSENLLPQQHVGVIKTDEHSILNVVSSLLPSMSRCFMECTEQTKFEDLKRMVRRFILAMKYFPITSERVFVIANVAVLPFEVLFSFVNLVKNSIATATNNNNNKIELGSLFIISSEDYNFFLPIMYDKKIELIVRSENQLRTYYNKVLGGRVHVIKSNIAGSGKTQFIKNNEWKNKFDLTHEYERIPIFEKIDNSMIIDKLTDVSIQGRRDQSKAVFFHFDLSAYVDRKADYLIFSLINGTIRDQKTCKIFHVQPNDQIYIECANVLSDYSSSSSSSSSIDNNALPHKWGCPFTRKILPCQRILRVNKKEFSTKGMSNEVQLVCKFLKRYRARDFSWFDPYEVEFIKIYEAYDIIVDFLGTNQPSYRLIRQMVEFFFYYFELLSGYELLRMTDFFWIKEVLMDMIVQSAEEFVRRHMDITTTTTTTNFFNRFQSLKSWEEISKPMLVLNLGRVGKYQKEMIDGFKVMALDDKWKNHVRNFEMVEQWLGQQSPPAKIDFDFRSGKLKRNELLKLMHSFEPKKEIINVDVEEEGERIESEMPFVFTKENTMKIFGILLRLKVGLPIILSGETGVGKSYQIQWICENFDYEFHKLTVHEGLEDHVIIQRMKKIILKSRRNPNQKYLVFFDEINTRPAMKLFELIMNDRTLGSDSSRIYSEDWTFPQNIKFVAALNPYRRMVSPPKGLVHPKSCCSGFPNFIGKL